VLLLHLPFAIGFALHAFYASAIKDGSKKTAKAR
jgi:hypothetical protein